MKLSKYLQNILHSEDLKDKITPYEELVDEYDWDNLLKGQAVPLAPSRSVKIKFSEKQFKFPKKNSLVDPINVARALHFFANHELLAIELMAHAILKYDSRDIGDDISLKVKKGILATLGDEQKHFNLYLDRMQELGLDFGDLPVNDYFWRQISNVKNYSEYFSTMALTFEAANLDFSGYYSKLFELNGDTVTSSIVKTVYEDELSHVGLGGHWLNVWRSDKTLWQYYMHSLPWPITPARSKGIHFNKRHRISAGLPEEFVNELISFKDDFKVTQRKL